MATLYIEEYAGLPKGSRNENLPVVGELIAKQKISLSSSSSQSSALDKRTSFVMLTADVAAQWEEGANPTADADSRYLPADTPRPFQVTGSNKIAARTQA